MKKSVKQLRVIALCLCVLAALASFTLAGYSQGKAILAQWLIASAWQQNQHGASEKPWYYADGYPKAKLIVEKLALEQFVWSEASMRNLAFGPGFWRSLEPSNRVIAGHNDTHFRFVNTLKLGDKISLQEVQQDVDTYQVSEILLIDKQDGAELDNYTNSLILVTCFSQFAWQTGSAQRLVVIAKKVAQKQQA